MEHKPLRDQIGHRCKFFTGIMNDQCEKDVEYKQVRITPPDGGMYHWPCTDPALGNCPLRELPTSEEIEAEIAQIRAAVNNLVGFETRATENCPHCGAHVDSLSQVGRCVYSAPCGCRLWQGKIPAAWR